MHVYISPASIIIIHAPTCILDTQLLYILSVIYISQNYFVISQNIQRIYTVPLPRFIVDDY